MSKTKKDNDREDRIIMEIVVDAYGPEERAIGWYYYLENTLQFPFTAKCKSRRQISPLKVGNTVEVTGMADVEECEREMFVEIYWDNGTLAVPLSQLDPVDVDDDETTEAVEDWHYWIEMRYEF